MEKLSQIVLQETIEERAEQKPLGAIPLTFLEHSARQEILMPQVLNKRRHGVPPGAVYVGRPTKWGNPYTHLAHGTHARFVVNSRDEAVERFESMLVHRLNNEPGLREQLRSELRGKDLVCWCAPARCHADVLLKYANEEGV